MLWCYESFSHSLPKISVEILFVFCPLIAQLPVVNCPLPWWPMRLHRMLTLNCRRKVKVVTTAVIGLLYFSIRHFPASTWCRILGSWVFLFRSDRNNIRNLIYIFICIPRCSVHGVFNRHFIFFPPYYFTKWKGSIPYVNFFSLLIWKLWLS